MDIDKMRKEVCSLKMLISDLADEASQNVSTALKTHLKFLELKSRAETFEELLRYSDDLMDSRSEIEPPPSDSVPAHQENPRQFFIELTDTISIVELCNTDYERTGPELDLIDSAGEAEASEDDFYEESFASNLRSKEEIFWEQHEEYVRTRTHPIRLSFPDSTAHSVIN